IGPVTIVRNCLDRRAGLSSLTDARDEFVGGLCRMPIALDGDRRAACSEVVRRDLEHPVIGPVFTLAEASGNRRFLRAFSRCAHWPTELCRHSLKSPRGAQGLGCV